MKRVLALLFLISGCAASIAPSPDPCTVPATGCVTEGDSPVWGAGPNAYCPGAGGIELHVTPTEVMGYEKEPGTRHTPAKIVCDTPKVDPLCTPPASREGCHGEQGEVGDGSTLASVVCPVGDGTQWRYQSNDVTSHEAEALNSTGHHDLLCQLRGSVVIWRTP